MREGTVGLLIFIKIEFLVWIVSPICAEHVVNVRGQNMTHRPSYKPINVPLVAHSENQFYKKQALLVASCFFRIRP